MCDKLPVYLPLGESNESSFPRKVSGPYQGLIHSVAETVIVNMVDLKGRKFQRRFMLDSGGMMCIMAEESLPAEGEWYNEDISHNCLRVSGVFEGVKNTSKKWVKVCIEPVDDMNHILSLKTFQ
jgi:hypothetical protein